jgi:4-carboxymuconolactone decarboxylase
LRNATKASSRSGFSTHGPRAQQLGIAPEIVEAIRNRREPDVTREDEKLVYDLTTEIMDKHALSDTTYARAKKILGEAVLIELMFSIGFYNMVGITLTSFDVPTPDGSKPLG